MCSIFRLAVAFLLLFCNCFILCVFNLEELKLISYEVDILKTPVKAGEEQAYPMMHVKSKHGQMYQCLLPLVEENENAEKRENIGGENIDIKELLKPIQSGSCLLKTKGWWTYEFCSGQYVKQYHIEDGKVLGQVITLGVYQSDYDWNNETDEGKSRQTKQRYHSQTYSNGSRCDLTNLPRTAEVRFYCEEDAGDYIFHVDEPGTCMYVLTVHTARICSHPRLKPLPSSKAHTISCSPLLDEEQYAQYLQKVDEEKSVAEKQRSKWLTNQQEKVKVMKSWDVDDADIQNDNFGKIHILGDGYSDSLAEYSDADDTMESETESTQAQTLADDIEENNDYLDEKLWNQYDLEKKLWKVYDKEIEKLKSLIPPERFSYVKDDLQKHVDSIINEAEELEVDLDSQSKDAAFSKLASTLNVLIEKLDKAGKAKGGAETPSVITGKTLEDQVGKSDNSDGLYNSENSQNQEHDKAVVFDDNKLHVRIRRLDRKALDSGGELHEMDFAQRKQLEQAVKEKLEKSGLDTGGRRIEVKIITAGYYDNEDGKDFHALTDEETNQFQNMIMALLTGQQEAIQEMERHKKLEENYRYVWNGIEQSESDDDE